MYHQMKLGKWLSWWWEPLPKSRIFGQNEPPDGYGQLTFDNL